MLQECSSWASRNGAVQIFLFTPNWNMFAGKFVNSERFLAVLREHIICNVKWVEIHKMSEVFWAKRYCKVNDLFHWFLLVLRLSARKSEVTENYDDVHWNVWTNVKMLYARNNIFKKRIQNMRFWIIFIFAYISFFGGLPVFFF